MAVIAQGQRFSQRARQRGKAGEMVNKVIIRQAGKANLICGGLIAVTQDMPGKTGRCDRIIKGRAKLGMDGLRGRMCHLGLAAITFFKVDFFKFDLMGGLRIDKQKAPA